VGVERRSGEKEEEKKDKRREKEMSCARMDGWNLGNKIKK
jgi:hypothetical protein